MSFWDKILEDKWFAFANLTLFGIVGYLAYNNYSNRQIQNYPDRLDRKVSNSSYLKQSNNGKVNLPRNPHNHPIYKICITGGPCAGKTTSIQQIKERFTDKGYRVFVVPEVPTMIVKSGGMILMGKLTEDQRINFQALLIKLQIYFEDYFSKLAAMSNLPSIILCDRGVMDPYAYISAAEFQTLLDEEGWNVVNLRDKRYDSVVFLVTAADGAEQHYTLLNNQARSEGVELAKQLDKKTQRAWNGHPHLSIIPNINGETFKEKIERAIQAVEKILGINSADQIHLKYVVEKYQFPKSLSYESFEVEEVFLQNEDPEVVEDKIRKRGQQNSYSYGRTIKYKEKSFVKRPITALEYLQLLSTKRDKKFEIMKKERITFVYEKQSFIIDKILLEQPLTVLRFSTKRGEEKSVKIPEFIELGDEVSTNKRYSTFELSQKNF